MSGKVTNIAELNLNGTKNGKITITTIEQPYGADSESVASIGISLKSNSSEPDWKVHIPKANIDNVISALQEAQKTI